VKLPNWIRTKSSGRLLKFVNWEQWQGRKKAGDACKKGGRAENRSNDTGTLKKTQQKVPRDLGVGYHSIKKDGRKKGRLKSNEAGCI